MRDGKTRVELNEEAFVKLSVLSKRSLKPGEEVTPADIDPAKCTLERPTLDGGEAAYYLFQSYFLDMMIYFDFTPNMPEGLESKVDVPGHRYPIAEVAAARQLLETIKPIEQFKAMAAAGWPPAPAYYPNVLVAAHKTPTALGDPAFAGTVAAAYTPKYLNDNVAFWKETNFFPGRLAYIEKAIDEYHEGDSISAIHVMAPQFEGIVRDYLSDLKVAPKYRFESQLKQLKQLVLSREVLVFPRQIVSIIFDFLEAGSFLAETDSVADPKSQVNRHGIAHGVFTGFESSVLALKYLVLLDGLALVLLQDRMLTGRI